MLLEIEAAPPPGPAPGSAATAVPPPGPPPNPPAPGIEKNAVGSAYVAGGSAQDAAQIQSARDVTAPVASQ